MAHTRYRLVKQASTCLLVGEFHLGRYSIGLIAAAVILTAVDFIHNKYTIFEDVK